jgi:hypothetical protein
VSDFSAETRAAIQATYDSCYGWIDNLEEGNQKSPSGIRDDYLSTLSELQQKIEHAGFFDKADFTPEEQNAIIALANEIAGVTRHIKTQNDLVLCELETDIADLVHRIALDTFAALLRGRWVVARRNYERLPKQIPDEVYDAFNVGMFTRAEYMLNRRATVLKPIAGEGCLNPDDYSNTWFVGMELKAADLSSVQTVDDYIQLDIDKRNAQLAAKLNESPSLGGIIWDIVGWDDPWDFAKDMVLLYVTGGTSKIVRWGKRLNAARKEVTKLTRRLRTLEGAIAKAEARLYKVTETAQKVKRLRSIGRIPEKIKKAFEALQDAKKQVELIAAVGRAITGDAIRNILTSVAANMAVNQSSKPLSTQASYEMVRMSAMQALEKLPPFTRIPTLRSSIGWTALFRTRGTGDHDALIGQYVAYVWLQEFVVRIVLAIAHQSNLSFKMMSNIAGDRSQPIVTVKMARDEAIAALGSAVERIWRDDLPFVPATVGEPVKRYVVALGRKALVELVQKVADLAAR